MFVSKADSSGYLNSLNFPEGTKSPLKAATETFLRWLLENCCRRGVQTVVSLFARAQDQYLFARSIENNLKHVLDDRGLIKWWCRILNPLIQSPPSSLSQPTPDSKDEEPATAYLTIPGLDDRECRSFLPGPSPFVSPPHWKIGHPLKQISNFDSDAVPPRCLIPHFPDDPKSRFLDELDDELLGGSQNQSSQSSQSNSQGSQSGKGKKGQWRSVKTLEMFWEMMAFRQECSAGRLVGFIWLVFPPSSLADLHPVDREVEERFRERPAISRAKRSRMAAKRKLKLKGPIIVRPPRAKVAKEEEGGRLAEKEYKRLHEMLLYLDFSTQKKAMDATAKWDRELKTLGVSGIEVVGKCEPKVVKEEVVVGVNTLQPRKKRKVGESGSGMGLDGANDGEVKVNVLNGSIIRKKPRVEEKKAEEPKVNVLGAGIVRRKPKA